MSGRLVPVFDVREKTEQADATNIDANTHLLVVSIDNYATGPMALGLLVEAIDGKLQIPPDAIRNLAGHN